MKFRLVLIALAIAFLLSGCFLKNLTGFGKPALVLPTVTNKTGKVLIQTVSIGDQGYLYNSYIITSSAGETVVIDPTNMPAKSIVDLKPALIISTHGHTDHIDPAFTDSYDAIKIKYTKEDIKTRDFRVYTVLSSHLGNTIAPSGNVIVVLEVDGLRIAHMGDIGQDQLTPTQLEELGKIDIAFMQFYNGHSGIYLTNDKAFNLIEQLNPTVIIPTHYADQNLPMLVKKYGKITDFKNLLAISKADLPVKPLTVYRILNLHRYTIK